MLTVSTSRVTASLWQALVVRIPRKHGLQVAEEADLRLRHYACCLPGLVLRDSVFLQGSLQEQGVQLSLLLPELSDVELAGDKQLAACDSCQLLFWLRLGAEFLELLPSCDSHGAWEPCLSLTCTLLLILLLLLLLLLSACGVDQLLLWTTWIRQAVFGDDPVVA